MPTVKEAGLKDFETGSWQARSHAGTPKDTIGRLNAEIKAFSTAEMKEMTRQGAEVYTMTPSSSAGWRSEIAKWVKTANLKLD